MFDFDKNNTNEWIIVNTTALINNFILLVYHGHVIYLQEILILTIQNNTNICRDFFVGTAISAITLPACIFNTDNHNFD